MTHIRIWGTYYYVVVIIIIIVVVITTGDDHHDDDHRHRHLSMASVSVRTHFICNFLVERLNDKEARISLFSSPMISIAFALID